MNFISNKDKNKKMNRNIELSEVKEFVNKWGNIKDIYEVRNTSKESRYVTWGVSVKTESGKIILYDDIRDQHTVVRIISQLNDLVKMLGPVNKKNRHVLGHKELTV